MDMDSREPWRTCRRTGLISHFAAGSAVRPVFFVSIHFYYSQYMCLLMAHAFFHIFLLTSDDLQGQNGITLPF